MDRVIVAFGPAGLRRRHDSEREVDVIAAEPSEGIIVLSASVNPASMLHE